MTHTLYTASDFTNEEYYGGDGLAKMVIDGGLAICKKCGAGEIQLDERPTCREFKEHLKEQS